MIQWWWCHTCQEAHGFGANSAMPLVGNCRIVGVYATKKAAEADKGAMFPGFVLDAVARRNKGVWLVWGWGDGLYVRSVFDDELEARRAAEDWDKVGFVEFGADIEEALK